MSNFALHSHQSLQCWFQEVIQDKRACVNEHVVLQTFTFGIVLRYSVICLSVQHLQQLCSGQDVSFELQLDRK